GGDGRQGSAGADRRTGHGGSAARAADAGSVAPPSRRRDREMVADHQGGGHQGGVTRPAHPMLSSSSGALGVAGDVGEASPECSENSRRLFSSQRRIFSSPFIIVLFYEESP